MSEVRFVLLYVADPVASSAFYHRLLGRAAVEQSPTFAMVPLTDTLMLGLWRRDGVAPAPDGTGGGSEIALVAADRAAVEAQNAAWAKAGVEIAQAPCQMDFGYTFVARDPDGHRIRVLSPEA